MLGEKCGIEFVCGILKFFGRFAPDKLKLILEYNVKERTERSSLWRYCDIVEKLSDIDRDTRILATKILAERKKRIITPLLNRKLSEEPDPVVRFGIATAIGEIRGRYAVKALIRAMGDENLYVRKGVTDALEKQGRRVLKEVIKYANSDNPFIRQSVAKVLCNIGRDDSHVRLVLAKLRRDPDEGVQNMLSIYCENGYKERDRQIEMREDNEKRI